MIRPEPNDHLLIIEGHGGYRVEVKVEVVMLDWPNSEWMVAAVTEHGIHIVMDSWLLQINGCSIQFLYGFRTLDS